MDGATGDGKDDAVHVQIPEKAGVRRIQAGRKIQSTVARSSETINHLSEHTLVQTVI